MNHTLWTYGGAYLPIRKITKIDRWMQSTIDSGYSVDIELWQEASLLERPSSPDALIQPKVESTQISALSLPAQSYTEALPLEITTTPSRGDVGIAQAPGQSLKDVALGESATSLLRDSQRVKQRGAHKTIEKRPQNCSNTPHWVNDRASWDFWMKNRDWVRVKDTVNPYKPPDSEKLVDSDIGKDDEISSKASLAPSQGQPNLIKPQSFARDGFEEVLVEKLRPALEDAADADVDGSVCKSAGFNSTAAPTLKKGHYEPGTEVADSSEAMAKIIGARDALRWVRQRHYGRCRHSQDRLAWQRLIKPYVDDIIREMEQIGPKVESVNLDKGHEAVRSPKKEALLDRFQI